MGRKKTQSQEIDQYAQGRLRSVFSNWILNQRNQEDFGFDYEVRMTETDGDIFTITPSNFFVQLKSSQKFDDNDSVYWDLNVDFVRDDCLPAPIPVILLIYERESDSFYWTVIQTYCWDILDQENEGWRDQRTVRVRIEREPLGEGLEPGEAFANRSKFRRNLTDAEDRIAFRRHVEIVNPKANDGNWGLESRIPTADDIETFKRRKLELAQELLEAGAKSRAIGVLLEIYQIPGKDRLTLEAIVELIEARDVRNPIIAIAQDDFSNTGIELAKELGESDTLDFLRDRKDITERVIRKWVPGSRIYDKEVGQEILVLTVQDWVHWTEDESMWIALMQYEDGDFWDEPAAALLCNSRYEVLELDEYRRPYNEGCEEGQHEFLKEDLRRGQGPAFCENCGFSQQVVRSFLNHDVPFVCEICETIKDTSEFTDGHVCKSCGNN